MEIKDNDKVQLQLSKARLQFEISCMMELAKDTEQYEAIPALQELNKQVGKITCEKPVENYLIQTYQSYYMNIAKEILKTYRLAQ
jgi:hypothetical protein